MNASIQFSLLMHAAAHLAAEYPPLYVESEPLVHKGQGSIALERMVIEMRDLISSRGQVPDLNSVLEVRVLGINDDGTSYSATKAIPGSKVLSLLSTAQLRELLGTVASAAGDAVFDINQQRNRAAASSTNPHLQVTVTAAPVRYRCGQAKGTTHEDRTYYSRPLPLPPVNLPADILEQYLLQLTMEATDNMSIGEHNYFEANNLPLLQEPVTEASFATLDSIVYQSEFTLKMVGVDGKRTSASFVVTTRQAHAAEGNKVLQDGFQAAAIRLLATEPALEVTA